MVVGPRIAATLSLTLALVVPAAALGSGAARTPSRLDGGKKLYREYCGDCHALKEAHATGLGAAGSKESDGEGGPSFNRLKISSRLCYLAVTGAYDGHDTVRTTMTWEQIYDVSAYLRSATRDHRRVVRPSSDDR